MLRTLWGGGHQPSWSGLHQTTGHPELVGNPGRRAWKGHRALLVTKLCSSCAVSVLSSVTAMWGNPCLHTSFASWSPAKPTLLKLESHLKHRFGYWAG